MKAIFVTGHPQPWAHPLHDRPWVLLPFGNRPLLEYWLELCVDFGISQVRLVLADGADQIEAYAGDGARWGLQIDYSFLPEERDPVDFLRRAPDTWREGLFFLGAPVFPRRLKAGAPQLPAAGTTRAIGAPGAWAGVLSRNSQFIEAFIAGRPGDVPFACDDLGLEWVAVESVGHYFELNMRLAAGEIGRYLQPGYYAADGACIGFNVIIPPSARIVPPVIIGNDCRIAALAVVGPAAVIGNRVVVDSQAEATRCLVLDGTYVGRQVEIREKIAMGDRLIDPADGEVAELSDPWLLSKLTGGVSGRALLCGLLGWALAVCLWALLVIPFLLLYGIIALLRRGRFERRAFHGPKRRVRRMAVFVPAARERPARCVRLFRAAALDLFPRLTSAAAGHLWLAGHELLRAPEDDARRDELPAYWPAVFSYATCRPPDSKDPDVAAMEARYYVTHRSVFEDLRIVLRALASRFAAELSEEDPNA